MGTEGSKLEKPKESSSGITNLENELCESPHLKSTNYLPETDHNSSCGLKNSASLLEKADSALDKDLGVLIIEQLKNIEKSTFDVDNVKITTTPLNNMEQCDINLDRRHLNLPLINEEIQSNLPLLIDNCQLNSPLILNKSQSESPLLLDNQSRSNSQPFVDYSLANSPFLVDTNQSESLLLPSIDQFQHSVLNDCKRLHAAVQPTCSANLHKYAEKSGIVTEASLFGSDLKDFTLTSIKPDVEEKAVQPSCSANLHKSEKSGIIATEDSGFGSDFTLPLTKSNIQNNTNEPKFLSSIFIEENNDFEQRSQYKKQLKNSPNNSKFKSAQELRNRKEIKDTIVPETLREVEKVANRLCSYTATKNNTGSNVKPSSDQHVLPLKPLKENVITQQVILNNLQYMNNFMSDLKSCPIFDEKVLFSLKSLKKSISSLISDGHNVSDDQDLDLAFQLLLDSLPDKFQKEKGKVLFKNGVPFCKICKQHLATNFLTVIVHLEDKNHQQLLRGFEEKPHDTFLPSDCKNNPKINTSKLEPTLKKNHEGVLEVIYNSKIDNLDMNLSLYICIVCDYWANDEKIAKIHLTDKSHIVQLNADWSFCSSCRLNIFGTADNFEEHSSSLLHKKILGLSDGISQNRITEEDIETCNPKEDKVQVSGSSSSSSVSSRVQLKPDTSNNESDEGSNEESSDETKPTFPPKIEFIQEDKQDNVVVLQDGTCISGKINSL